MSNERQFSFLANMKYLLEHTNKLEIGYDPMGTNLVRIHARFPFYQNESNIRTSGSVTITVLAENITLAADDTASTIESFTKELRV